MGPPGGAETEGQSALPRGVASVSHRSTLLPILVGLLVPLGAQEPKSQAQALVKEAIAFARREGKEALLRETNQGQGRFHTKGSEELYLFIYDMQGTCQAIGFQSHLVGVNRWGLKDPDGKYFLQEMIRVARTHGSGWVTYKYPNPLTGRVEPKMSYVEYFEGWLVGCGVYQ